MNSSNLNNKIDTDGMAKQIYKYININIILNSSNLNNKIDTDVMAKQIYKYININIILSSFNLNNKIDTDGMPPISKNNFIKLAKLKCCKLA